MFQSRRNKYAKCLWSCALKIESDKLLKFPILLQGLKLL